MSKHEAKGIFDRILDIAGILGMVAILSSLFFVCVRVFSRLSFDEPLNWVIDVASILLLYSTFLGAAWLLRDDGHPTVDIAVSLLKPKHHKLLDIITSILSILIFAIITWYGVKVTWASYADGLWLNTTLRPPKYIVQGIIPAGSFLLFVQLIRKTYGLIKEYRNSD